MEDSICLNLIWLYLNTPWSQTSGQKTALTNLVHGRVHNSVIEAFSMHNRINKTVQSGEYIRNDKDNNTRNDIHNIEGETMFLIWHRHSQHTSPCPKPTNKGQSRVVFVDRKMLHYRATMDWHVSKKRKKDWDVSHLRKIHWHSGLNRARLIILVLP